MLMVCYYLRFIRIVSIRSCNVIITVLLDSGVLSVSINTIMQMPMVLVQGFTLNNTIYQLLVARYSDPNMTIDFDNFVGCLMRLEMMFSESKTAPS